MREVPMIGDYPTRGPRLWLFIAAVVVIGLVGAVMMLFFASKGKPVQRAGRQRKSSLLFVNHVGPA